MIVLQSAAKTIVPQGPPIIAQRFNAGFPVPFALSPEGTAELLSLKACFVPPLHLTGVKGTFHFKLDVREDRSSAVNRFSEKKYSFSENDNLQPELFNSWTPGCEIWISDLMTSFPIIP